MGALPDLGDGAVARDLKRAFEEMRADAPNLKMFVAHYPQADLPGRCVGVLVVIHDLPDPMVRNDLGAAEEFARALHERFAAPGRLLEIRQVWQLAGERPRMIEATIELTDQFDRLMHRKPPIGYFGDDDVERITFDRARGAHFSPFGGGARRGLLWTDRSCGLGESDPYSAAYRMRPARTPDAPLSPAVAEALREFIRRF